MGVIILSIESTTSPFLFFFCVSCYVKNDRVNDILKISLFTCDINVVICGDKISKREVDAFAS